MKKRSHNQGCLDIYHSIYIADIYPIYIKMIFCQNINDILQSDTLSISTALLSRIVANLIQIHISIALLSRILFQIYIYFSSNQYKEVPCQATHKQLINVYLDNRYANHLPNIS